MSTTLEFPSVIGLPSYPLTETYDDNVIRTKMEDGTVKQRPRTTRVRKTYEVKWSGMPDVEKQALDEFFSKDLKGGAVSFLWPHPLTKKKIAVQFTEPYHAEISSVDYWTVSMKIKEV